MGIHDIDHDWKNKDLCEWNADDVYNWLCESSDSQLCELAAVLKRKKVSGWMLGSVQDGHLKKLNVSTKDRLTFKCERDKLFRRFPIVAGCSLGSHLLKQPMLRPVHADATDEICDISQRVGTQSIRSDNVYFAGSSRASEDNEATRA